jgi:uncharacterized membrane protein YdjX (TVP38/TMEM64 family)
VTDRPKSIASDSAEGGDDCRSLKRDSWLAAWGLRLAILAVLLAVVGGLSFYFRDALKLENLAQRETQLRAFQQEQPVATFAVAFAVYVLVTGLSLPGASPLTVLYGWLFSFWPALLLVSFASTTGATLAFLASRYLFGELVQSRFGDRLERFHEALRKEGAFYLFTLRLIPAVPFFVINVVMGLTRMRVWTFWWVSQVGMLAGTCVFVFAGSSVPSLKEVAERGVGSLLDIRLVIAFVLLGVFPLAARRIMARLRPAAVEQAGQGEKT